MVEIKMSAALRDYLAEYHGSGVEAIEAAKESQVCERLSWVCSRELANLKERLGIPVQSWHVVDPDAETVPAQVVDALPI